MEEHSIAEKIAKANKQALERLVAADPYLIGCALAKEVIPKFHKNLILHWT